MKLIAAVDLSEASAYILEAVHRVATATDAEVVLINVVPPVPTFPNPEFQPVVDSAENKQVEELREGQLAELGEQLSRVGVSTTSIVRHGHPGDTVLDEAKSHGVELIVVGSHGHGVVFDALVGSVSAHILRHSQVHVLVVPVRQK